MPNGITQNLIKPRDVTNVVTSFDFFFRWIRYSWLFMLFSFFILINKLCF